MTLGELTGKVFEILEHEAYAYDDPMGGWEVGRLIARHTDRQLRELLAEHGFSPQSFVEELESRTSYRWVHDSGVERVLA